jgi:hypothetical protein
MFAELIATHVSVPTEKVELGELVIADIHFEFRELSDVESDTQLLVLLPDQTVMMAFPARANPGWADFSGMVLSMAQPETNKELQNI